MVHAQNGVWLLGMECYTGTCNAWQLYNAFMKGAWLMLELELV